jgi:arginase
MGWTLIGAPLDSTGAGLSGERAPAAMRAAGLAERLGAADLGDVDLLVRAGDPDGGTGVIAAEAVEEGSLRLAARVADVIAMGDRPLVVGGDCTVTIGAVAGARRHGPLGVWYVDGRPDFVDPTGAPACPAGDLALAMVCGIGPDMLVALAGAAPMVEPADVVLLGVRPAGTSDALPRQLTRIPWSVLQLSARAIAAKGPAAVAEAVVHRVPQHGRMWLHVSLDVLDEAVMPAVRHPQPHGLDWTALAELVRPLLDSPALIGVSLVDLDPDADHDGAFARRVTDVLVGPRPVEVGARPQ